MYLISIFDHLLSIIGTIVLQEMKYYVYIDTLRQSELRLVLELVGIRFLQLVRYHSFILPIFFDKFFNLEVLSPCQTSDP